jgi:hypothetical protein
MNFYDGRTVTPFLPISKLLKLYRECITYHNHKCISFFVISMLSMHNSSTNLHLFFIFYFFFDDSGSTIPMHITCDDGWPTKINR